MGCSGTFIQLASQVKERDIDIRSGESQSKQKPRRTRANDNYLISASKDQTVPTFIRVMFLNAGFRPPRHFIFSCGGGLF